MTKSKPAGERAFLRSLRAQIARGDHGPQPTAKLASRRGQPAGIHALTLGIGDDCAILQPPLGHELLVTTDFSLETLHFRRDWHSPESAGHRCLARGLSDIAAMGGWPLAAFLSIALPAELVQSRARQDSWRARFLNGFLALANRYQVPLAGGDTAMSPTLAKRSRPGQGLVSGLALADVVVIGSTPTNRALRRSGARAGDLIYVTGFLGGAATELSLLRDHPVRFRRIRSNISDSRMGRANPHPHLFPEPRLPFGSWLLKHHRASAAIDISDGLSTDLDHLCEESRLNAVVDASMLPIHPLASANSSSEALRFALHGGDEYELLFTAPPALAIPKRHAGLPITRIGQMVTRKRNSPRISLVEEVNGRKRVRALPVGGWEHTV